MVVSVFTVVIIRVHRARLIGNSNRRKRNSLPLRPKMVQLWIMLKSIQRKWNHLLNKSKMKKNDRVIRKMIDKRKRRKKTRRLCYVLVSLLSFLFLCVNKTSDKKKRKDLKTSYSYVDEELKLFESMVRDVNRNIELIE